MSKAIRECIGKAAKLISTRESELDEASIGELKQALTTVNAIIEKRKELKASLKEYGELLEASGKDLAKALRSAKKAAKISAKEKLAARLAEKSAALARPSSSGK